MLDENVVSPAVNTSADLTVQPSAGAGVLGSEATLQHEEASFAYRHPTLHAFKETVVLLARVLRHSGSAPDS